MRSSFFSRSRTLTAAIAALVALSSEICLAANFSADMVTKFGTRSVPGKLYVSGSNWRQESSAQGRQRILIARGKTMYQLDPVLRQYQQGPVTEKPWSASAMVRVLGGGMNKKSCGTKVVNGITCEKVVYTPKQKAPGIVTQYISKELDLPVRTEINMQPGMLVTEFKNVKRITPPASLFQVPKGYKKIASPNAQAPAAKAKSKAAKGHKK